MVVLPAKTLFKYRAMDYKSLAILLWSLVYWSNSLASKGWTLLALCPVHPLWMILSGVSPNLLRARSGLMLQPEPSRALRNNKLQPPSEFPCPSETIVQNTDILFTPIFWFTLIKETKVKDHVKWRIPLGLQWLVSACLGLLSLLAKERPAGLTPAPGQSLSSCLLFTTDIGISIFCPTKIKRRWFLIVSESNL